MVRTEEDEFREFNLLKNSLNKQKEYYEQRIKQIFDKLDSKIIKYFQNPITYDIKKEDYEKIKSESLIVGSCNNKTNKKVQGVDG